MNKQAAIITISAVIIAVVGVIVYGASLGSKTISEQPTSTTTQNQQDDADITRTIDALHQFQPDNNQHIVAGTTTVPTPCHQLSTDTEIRESDPEQVVLNFSSSAQDDAGACAQVVQEIRFKVTFRAGESANIIGGTYGDDTVELNLREVGADQNLEDFQIYTKG